MGIGMQIVYLGFPGAARIEVEACVQFVRLERFSPYLEDCHLTVEALRSANGSVYDAQLDLLLQNNRLVPVPHCSDADPKRAVRAAFNYAVNELSHRAGALP
jgi:hypothetical protein